MQSGSQVPGMMKSQPSNPFTSTNAARFSSLEEMNAEGQETIAKKDAELRAYTQTVAEAERILAQLNRQIEQKTAELAAIQARDDEQDAEQLHIQRELAELDEKHNAEIAALRAKHEKEMATLRSDFEQTLREAEEWANHHSEIALQDKMRELTRLKEEAQEAKRQLNEVMFVKNRTREARAIDSHQKDNADQIAKLEEQISELTALTREEMRDARAKIDECVAAVELRRQGNAAELKRLDDEARDRKERYDAHINALREEYELERSTIEQQIAAANARAENTERIIQRLEQHHEAQLTEVLGDIETMRRSCASPSAQSLQYQERMRATIRESQRLSEEFRNIEQESVMIDREINELESENRELKHELARLNALLAKSA